MDQIVYNPGGGFYRYVRQFPRGKGQKDLGDIYKISTWSDPDGKFEMIYPHHQLKL